MNKLIGKLRSDLKLKLWVVGQLFNTGMRLFDTKIMELAFAKFSLSKFHLSFSYLQASKQYHSNNITNLKTLFRYLIAAWPQVVIQLLIVVKISF